MERAARDGYDLLYRAGAANCGSKLINGFYYPPKNFGLAGYDGDFLTRAAIQCMIGLIALDTTENVYLYTHTDHEGNSLYRMKPSMTHLQMCVS